jgi:hypothetical protein
MRSRRTVLIALAIGALSGCGQPAPAVSDAGSAEVPAPLNGLSAAQVIDDFRKAGLPAQNPQEITSVKCAKVPCLEAISTDTVSVFKFRATGLAQRYIESRSNVFQIEDLVLAFAPNVTDAVKQRYERVVAGAI